jgi:hypothetical protein
MNADWHILSHIATEIQQAADFQEVVDVWHWYLHYLDDCKLIYTQPREADTVVPSRNWPRRFPKGGFLRPLLAHDNLYFMDRRIAAEQRRGVRSPLKIDSTVEFDTNVASYVEGFVEGRLNHNTEMIGEVLDFVLTGERVNFGYNFYALENASGFYDGSRVDSIRRNLRAIMKLDHLDRERYRKTGEVVSTITDGELDAKADEKLHEFYDTTYREGMAAEFTPLGEMLYLVLLKTVEIEHGGEGKSLESKMAELYGFMHFELKTMLVREAITALHYYKSRSSLSFFGKFVSPRPKEKADRLLKELKGMSWDLMLFRMMERFAAVPGQGDFLLPYFLTFDRRMVDLFDLLPLKAVFAYGEAAQMMPLWESLPLDVLKEEMNIAGIEGYFSQTASSIRLAERTANPRPDYRELKKELEAEVVRLLTY